jgi:prepilin peptidase CpaA
MNLATTAPTWLLVVLAALLVAAAVEDIRRLRISNITCLGVLLTAIAAMAFAGFPLALWQNLVVFAVILAGGTLLFGAGKVGGGDVKLLAALGLWVDFQGAVWLLAAVFIGGGVLAMGYIMTALARRRAPVLGKGRRKSLRIPYGLAIVVGTFFILSVQAHWIGPKYQKPDPFSVRIR